MKEHPSAVAPGETIKLVQAEAAANHKAKDNTL